VLLSADIVPVQCCALYLAEEADIDIQQAPVSARVSFQDSTRPLTLLMQLEDPGAGHNLESGAF
jgi:hypothetical protein